MDSKKNNTKGIPPEYGFITRGVAAFFRFLQKTSISQLFIGNRIDAFRRSDFPHLTDEQRKKAAARRARRVDLFICGCIALEILGVIIGGTSFGHTTIVRWLLVIAVVLRLIDIIQVNINLSLFDVLHTGKDYHYMASVVRSIINVMINYFEIILCYGILYGYCEPHLDKARDWMDAFYFSAVTQVTVGFGEMMPRGALRWVTVSQFLLGYFFTALIIGRFISLLPQSRTIAGDGQSDGPSDKS
jgi:Ion channel